MKSEQRKRHDGFKKGSGLFTCQACGKRTRDVDGENGPSGLCPQCYVKGSLENEHNDGYHARVSKPDCPLCQAAEAKQREAEKEKAAARRKALKAREEQARHDAYQKECRENEAKGLTWGGYTKTFDGESVTFYLNNIEMACKVDYDQGSPHLEFRGEPSVLTETGYRSHFVRVDLSHYETLRDAVVGEVEDIIRNRHLKNSKAEYSLSWPVTPAPVSPVAPGTGRSYRIIGIKNGIKGGDVMPFGSSERFTLRAVDRPEARRLGKVKVGRGWHIWSAREIHILDPDARV